MMMKKKKKKYFSKENNAFMSLRIWDLVCPAETTSKLSQKGSCP